MTSIKLLLLDRFALALTYVIAPFIYVPVFLFCLIAAVMEYAATGRVKQVAAFSLLVGQQLEHALYQIRSLRGLLRPPTKDSRN